MNERELRIFWRITGLHIALVASILIFPFMKGCFSRESNDEVITLIDLSLVQPADIPVEVPPPEPEPPAPDPEPPAPDPEPPVPGPEPEQRRREIEISRERVRRDPTPPTRPRLTQEEIRRRLERELGGQPKPPVQTDVPAWYYALVRDAMNAAWNEPAGLSLPPGATTRVRIRVQRDGRITRREQIRSSGNSTMDSSVMTAVNSVTRLRELPSEVRGEYKDITIDFELQSGL